MPISPHFEEYQGLLRFHVPVGGALVEAFLSRATCQAGDGRPASGVNLLDFYRAHRLEIDDIVLDKLRTGVRGPVVVMARDLWRCGSRRAAWAPQPVCAESRATAPATLD